MLCCVLLWLDTEQFYPYSSGSFHWYWGIHTHEATPQNMVNSSNFKWILVINGWGIYCEIPLIWMSLDFTDDQSTLVEVMAWCRQATSHYLSQCLPRSHHMVSLGHYELTKLHELGKANNITTTKLHTVQCRYSAVNFLQNPHKWQPIAHPLGWGIIIWGSP